jgi:uncharacterized protein (DUF885 family)
MNYRQYLHDEYLPFARVNIALSANPQGEACYQALLRESTSLNRPARQTFELGLKQVEHNTEEALNISRKNGIDTLSSLIQRINDDPSNHFLTTDELLKFSRDAVSRGRQSAPKWFDRIPEAPVLIEPYPAFAETGAAGGVLWPAGPGGNPPAIFRIPLSHLSEATRSRAEVTAFHETYPGHHIQLGLANEMPTLHPISRIVGTAAFREGWARYAEALAEQMGLYQSQYATASRRLWPSRGMVVDPGIHLYGWTREKAVAYMIESGNMGPEVANALVDRIAISPGQLTAYDRGAAEFFDLRREAESRLGRRFDIRQFHQVVLRNGAVTLPMLRDEVESWLKTSVKDNERNSGRNVRTPSDSHSRPH